MPEWKELGTVCNVVWTKTLYDVTVSDCPYCGGKRKVVKTMTLDGDDVYEVTHTDIMDALRRGCFDAVRYFGSPEEALQAANRRGEEAESECVMCGKGLHR